MKKTTTTKKTTRLTLTMPELIELLKKALDEPIPETATLRVALDTVAIEWTEVEEVEQ